MCNITVLNFNNSQLNEEIVDINQKYKLYLIVPLIWSLFITLGLLANSLVIYIIIKKKLFKSICTHCYFLNVAIADLCFTIVCVPITMSGYIYSYWIFGNFVCQLQNFLMFVSDFLISVSRFYINNDIEIKLDSI
jgi:hypothetical protein